MTSDATGSDRRPAAQTFHGTPGNAAANACGTSLKAMLFVHIPKTAGTSLRQGVAEFLGRERMELDYGPKQSATTALVQRWRHQQLKPDKFRVEFDLRGMRFLSGHINLADYIGGFDLDNIAVFIRDPVQRVISEYQHYARHYGYSQSLEDFVMTATFQNKQTRALAGVPIERLGFVGLTERYDESLARLNAHFGWDIPARNVNMGRSHTSESYGVDKATRRLLERNNALDLDLYHRARALFKQFRQPGLPNSRESAIGSCRLGEGNTLEGWACQIGGERATTVRVEVNDEIFTHIRADRFRPDIRRRGLKRSGCAGFKLQIPSCSPGDVIRCIETDGGTELNNSPLRIGPMG